MPVKIIEICTIQQYTRHIGGTMHYFFTKEDFDALNQEILACCDRIKDAAREMALSCQEGADTFHDNFAYEQGERDQMMWSNRVRELIRIRNNVKIITLGPNDGRVSIGRIVQIRDLNSGEIQIFKVGSYMVFDNEEESDLPIFSYEAQLLKTLIDAKVGEEREVSLGGKKHRFVVVKIE